MPKISMKLNSASVDAALREVQQYGRSLSRKTDELRRRVAQVLSEMVSEGFNGAQYDDVIHEGTRVPDVQVTVSEKGDVSVVIAHGKEAVFAEFGAGVYYNGPAGSFPHPNPPAGIVAIGTYGEGRGARKIWGYYDNGELKLTHGTPASMPMYHAVQEIARRLPDIAKEVFAAD